MFFFLIDTIYKVKLTILGMAKFMSHLKNGILDPLRVLEPVESSYMAMVRLKINVVTSHFIYIIRFV